MKTNWSSEKNFKEKVDKCYYFFYNLKTLLYFDYEEVKSCNADRTIYLVPNGTRDEITYSSKPYKSFRVSDHWNWYANINKCPYEKYVQCLSADLPYAKRRPREGAASDPIKAIQVSVIGKDGKYHCVYGEVFDRKTKTWGWMETDPKIIIENLCNV